MKILYIAINWYTQQFPFPRRGRNLFHSFLRSFQLATKMYKKKLFNGLFMYVNATDHIQQSIFWYGYYEKSASLLWQSLIKQDSLVLDIGANIGYFSLLAAARATRGKVVAFEPVSSFRIQMQKNLALNSFQQVELLPYCVSDKKEWTNIFLAGEDNLGMSGIHPPENFSGRTEKAACIVLDDWRKSRLPTVNILKIDIEGAEKKALDGMKELLQNDQPIIFMEVMESLLSKSGSSVAEIYTTLAQYGYHAYEIIHSTALQRIHKPKEGYDLVFIPKNYPLPGSIKVYL